MHPLTRDRTFAHLVLAWFLLALGVAIAAPVVNPQSAQMLCVGGSAKWVLQDDDGDAAVEVQNMDCPLCMSVAGPPPAAPVAQSIPPLSYGVQPVPAARIAALTAAPPPARGPPSLA